jgi:PAS domain S-box-containing protein
MARRGSDLIVPEERREEFGALFSAMQRGERTTPLDTVRVTRTGEAVHVHLWMSPVADGDGNLLGASMMVFDNSDQVATRAALVASEARHRALVDTLIEFVLVTDANGYVMHAQPSWSAFTGQDFTAYGGLGWFDAVKANDRRTVQSVWTTGVADERPFALATHLQHESGEFRYCEARATPMHDCLGRIVEWVVAFSDVHDRHVAEEHERLTASYWRRIYAANVFGIGAGDGDRLVDANDAMLDLLGVTRKDLNGGLSLSGRFIAADAAAPVLPFGDGEAGVYEIRRNDGSYASVLAATIGPEESWIAVAADVTGRKAAARGAAAGTPHESAPARADRRWLERELERALERNTLTLAFQPVIDLRAGSTVGAEALLRWQVDGETIPTAQAIAVAEDTGIIVRLSDWVIREACRQFSEWRTLEPRAHAWRLHINISARDLADERFVDRVLRGLAEGGCAPSDLCLEVTETAMLHHPEQCHARLRTLREAGVVVAIDDFGMGYASLGVLRDVPADIVKIDRSFVADLKDSERDRAIVEHAIDLSHRLGLIVVGEGVESLAQRTILEEYGCDRAQGYAFAPPGAIDALPLEPERS